MWASMGVAAVAVVVAWESPFVHGGGQGGDGARPGVAGIHAGMAGTWPRGYGIGGGGRMATRLGGAPAPLGPLDPPRRRLFMRVCAWLCVCV